MDTPLPMATLKPSPLAANGSFMDPYRTAAQFGISGGMRIADLGAGNGYFTLAMAKLVGESGSITAVDVLSNPLYTIESKAKIEGLTNIRTQKGNLEIEGGSGLSGNSQDIVLLKNVLFQSQNKDSIIKEAARILKENGKLIIIDWLKGAGGLGPPDNLRTDLGYIQQEVGDIGFRMEKSIEADKFHYGFLFRKVIK